MSELFIKIYSQNGKETNDRVELNKKIFSAPYLPGLIHQEIRTYLLNSRSASPLLKDRSTVHGTGKKLYRQKGRGAARHSNMRAPQIRGGAVMKKPRREWDLKINVKMKRGALRSILSKRLEESRIIGIDVVNPEAFTKTKDLMNFFLRSAENNIDTRSSLLVRDIDEVFLYQAARNLDKVSVRDYRYLNTYSVMKATTLVFSKKAIEAFNQSYLGL